MTIHADNERILTLMSEYLCFTPTAIQPGDVTALAADCAISLNDAYMALLAAHCGLDTARPDDARLYRAYFPQMIRQESPDTYLSDAYLQAVRPASGDCGGGGCADACSDCQPDAASDGGCNEDANCGNCTDCKAQG